MKQLQGKTKRTIIPDLVVSSSPSGGTIATSPFQKATALNSFFCQQTVLPGCDLVSPDKSSLKVNSHRFDSISTTPRDVYDILSTLRIDKAPGIDNLTPRLLRFCARGISTSIATLLNRSFTSGTFPAAWKKATVIPIFKKGARSEPGNYRPIALLPILSKVMERIVHNKLSHFLRPWTSKYQSGFKKKDGTVHQLTRLFHCWSAAVDDGQYVGAVFFDLRKAFDKV